MNVLRSRVGALIAAAAIAAAAQLGLTGVVVAQQPASPLSGVEYYTLTADTVQRLSSSAGRIRSDDPAGTRSALRTMQDGVAAVLGASLSALERADQGYERAATCMQTLESRAAELSNEESGLVAKETQLNDKFAVVSGSIQDTAKANQDLLHQKWALVEGISRHCEELAKDYHDTWQYVPIGDLISSAGVDRCYRKQGESNQEFLAVYQSYKSELHQLLAARAEAKSGLAQVRAKLATVRPSLRKVEYCLAKQKEAVVYYSDLGEFWRRVDALLRLDVQHAVDVANEVAKLQESDPESQARRAALDRARRELRSSLDGFRKTYLDGGKLRRYGFGTCAPSTCQDPGVSPPVE